MNEKSKNINDLEQLVYDRMLEDFKNIEKNLVDKILHDNFSILIGEHELIEDFSNFLEYQGVDIGQDINHLLIGSDINLAKPVKIIRKNFDTNDIKVLDMCLIKKSDRFMDIILKSKFISNEREKDEDLNKLIYIELDISEGKKCIYSNCLEKTDDMNEKNILFMIGKLFNIEKGVKAQLENMLEDLKKEQENNDIMYV